MAKMIELTDCHDRIVMVNIDNILWVTPYDEKNTQIYLAAPGNNGHPTCLPVKMSYDEVKKKIVR